MKKIFIGLLIVSFLIISSILIVPSFIDWNQYKQKAIDELQNQTGLQLVINGDLKFSILPSPQFSVEKVGIQADKPEKYKNILEFERLNVAVELMPLLQGVINIGSITIKSPSIFIEKYEDGTLNLDTQKISSQDKGEAEQVGNLPDISLDNIEVKEAKISYYDHNAQSEQIVQNINADLAARSIFGPYKAQGSLFYDGHSINFDISTNVFDQNTGLITPQIEALIQPLGIELKYNGVLSLNDDLSVQGQTELALPDLTKLSDIFKSQTPFTAKGLLTADSNEVSFKNLKLFLGQQEIAGAFKAKLDPFQYELEIKTQDTLNLSKSMGNEIPFKTTDFDINFKGNDKKLEISAQKLNVDETKLKLSGSLDKLNQKRPVANLSITSQKIIVDDLAQQNGNGSSNATSIEDIIKNLSLPMDVNLNVQAKSLIYDGKEIRDLSLQTELTEDAIRIKNFNISNALGVQISSNATLTSLKTKPVVDSYMSIQTKNIKEFMTAFEFDASTLPSGLKSVDLKTKLVGSLNSLNMTSNMNAFGANILTKGVIKNALAEPSISGIEFQIKHKNMAQIIENITEIPVSDKNLRKPLDLYTKIDQEGSVFKLNDIKGDLSGTSVNGTLSLNTASKIPTVKGSLEFGNLKLAALADKKQSSSKERWSKESIDVTGLHSANVDIDLKANTINYGSWPLTKPEMKIVLREGNLDIKDLRAKIYGGSINAQINVQTDPKPRQPLYFESKSSFKNADIGQLAESLIGTQLVKLSGTGNVEMDIKSSGASVAALIYDLGGEGNVDAKDIILEGVDVNRFVRALSNDSKPGDTLTGLWKGTTAGGSTKFDTLQGDIKIEEGVVSLSQMNLDGTQTRIETDGKINLPEWTLETKHKMSVKSTEGSSSDVPPFEMSFKGSLDNPAQTFGKGLLEDYLDRKIKRKFNKILSDKFGVPVPSNDNKKQNAQQGKESSKPKTIEDAAEDAIKGVLDGLLR